MNNVKMVGILLIGLLIGALVFTFSGDSGFSQEELDDEINLAVQKAQGDLKTELDSSYAITIKSKETEIANLQISLAEQLANKGVEIVEEIKETLGYLLDKFFIGEVINETISDREVKTLLDYEIECNDDDYDVEEIVTLSNMEVEVNGKDFESDPYLVISKNAIKYSVVFDKKLNASDEETCSFSFLGKELEVSEWKDNEVTFFEGTVYYLEEGVTQTIEGQEVELILASDNQALIRIGENSREVDEGETKKIGGLDIKLEYVFETTNFRIGQAKIFVSSDIENTVGSGDEYIEDSVWKYVIGTNSIGIRLIEHFKELDDDYKPLASGESLCLPNDYVCVRYDGFLEEDTEELSFELEEDNNVKYVGIRGDFQYGTEDYDKILVNRSNGEISNEDDVVLNESVITLGSSDVELVLNRTNLLSTNNFSIDIKDFWVDLDLNVSSEKASADYDVRTNFGIKVNSPEDAIEDNDWTIVVNYNRLESTITVL